MPKIERLAGSGPPIALAGTRGALPVRRRKVGAATLLEILVAIGIIAAALPVFVDSWVTIHKLRRAQVHHSHGTNLVQVVYENIHYRIYNEDSRGYRLNDPASLRVSRYAPENPADRSYLDYIMSLGGPDLGILPPSDPAKDPAQSVFFQDFVQQPDGTSTALSPQTHPLLTETLRDFRLDVNVFAHLDESAGDPTDLDLMDKMPDEPKVDLARVEATIHWAHGQGQLTFNTRFTRPIREPDPLRSEVGR